MRFEIVCRQDISSRTEDRVIYNGQGVNKWRSGKCIMVPFEGSVEPVICEYNAVSVPQNHQIIIDCRSTALGTAGHCHIEQNDAVILINCAQVRSGYKVDCPIGHCRRGGQSRL